MALRGSTIIKKDIEFFHKICTSLRAVYLITRTLLGYYRTYIGKEGNTVIVGHGGSNTNSSILFILQAHFEHENTQSYLYIRHNNITSIFEVVILHCIE